MGIEDPEAWLDASHPRKVALWEAFGELEPFGEEAADLRIGMLIAAIDQLMAGEKSQAKPEQFSMRFKGKRKKKGGKKVQSASKQLAVFRSVMDYHAAAVRANNV